ncbi:MAG: hypothetical protein WA966_14605 [Ornithinimicrobium sp.]
MGQGVADEAVLELGPSGRLRVVLRIVAVLGVVVAVLLVLAIGSADGGVWRLIVFPVLQLMVSAGPIVVVHLRTTVRIDPTGITISGGHRQYRGSWAWPEILEVAMVRQGSWAIAVRPRGSVWDAPGPQSPAAVTVPFRDRAARETACDRLSDLCEQHGVLFTENGDGVGSAPPGSSLRADGR